ncbi:hypothetical protein A1OE_1269 [Candidatus Endolissoclinum faulkneri L2]|uniref:Uncharacterized protein n=1 Tax=Candidatus Endolissoclinum faulkneri L2 TaxID=1193729 RepID=K7Z5U8_9PROT|nr:hypothetical protein A1OE_1269 [Candidatus Endolissoclinum faulkneri L2]
MVISYLTVLFYKLCKLLTICILKWLIIYTVLTKHTSKYKILLQNFSYALLDEIFQF